MLLKGFHGMVGYGYQKPDERRLSSGLNRLDRKGRFTDWGRIELFVGRGTWS